MILVGSRYADQPVVSIMSEPDGRSTVAVLGPPRQVPLGFTYYTVREGERYDILAARFFSRADLWWRLADANPEVFYPDQLVSGTIIRIPV